MRHYYRRTAPGARDGRVRKKNNWKRTPDCYSVPQWEPAIDRERPGEGYRHFLMKRDVERFVELIPHWDDISQGLDVIVLSRGRPDFDGWYNCGVLGICAWDTNNIVSEENGFWYADHRGFFERINARVESRGPDDDVVIHWTPDTIRAYQLCHVFLHELGHHIDRMCTRSKRDNGPRGEDWAEQYAWAYEVLVLERYFEEFGMPE